MKNKSFTIKVENPCRQDWDKLPRKDGGLYCSDCKKVVHDFSVLSDEELIHLFTKKSSGEMCGLFRKDQLNREFIPPTEKKHSFRSAKILLLSLFSLKFINDIQAAPSFKQTINYFEQQKYSKVSKRISGRTTDLITGKPLANITVSIAGHALQTTSDSTGHFKLIIPDSIKDENFTLQIGTKDYWVADTTIAKKQLPFVANFRMTKVVTIAAPIETPDLMVVKPVQYELHSAGAMDFRYEPIIIKPNLWQRIRMKFRRKSRR